MDEKLKAIEMYHTDEGFQKYTSAIKDIGLWKSEAIIIEKYINKNSNILDLGCGAGRTTFGLYDIGYQNIVGLDLSEKFINYASNYRGKHHIGIEFVLGDSCNLPFVDNSFDFVFYSFNGLQLIPGTKNRLSALKEIYRVLNNNGYFIFTAHDREEPAFAEFWKQEKERWDNNQQDEDLEVFGDMIVMENGGRGFIHYSSIAELKDMLETLNFKIIECIRRSDIVDENPKVKDFSSDTIFWVLRKEDENEFYKNSN